MTTTKEATHVLKTSTPDHPQTTVRVGARAADVDEGMAELIVALWEAGFDTSWSCQGEPGRHSAYLSMPVETFERFLPVAADVLDLPDMLVASNVVVIGELPDGMSVVERDFAMGCSAIRDLKGWVVNVSLQFPATFISDLTDAVTNRRVA